MNISRRVFQFVDHGMASRIRELTRRHWPTFGCTSSVGTDLPVLLDVRKTTIVRRPADHLPTLTLKVIDDLLTPKCPNEPYHSPLRRAKTQHAVGRSNVGFRY
jgi:hypothetical protein